MSIPANYNGPINLNPLNGEATISIFGYVPSRALACIGAIVFALGLLTHVVYLIRLPSTRSFQAFMSIGCAMEVGGYIIRILAHYNPFLVSYFVAQYFLIVVAPCFFSGAFYLALALAVKRLPVALAHGLLSFPPKFFVIMFIFADVITTAIQITGAALIGVSESARTRGKGSTSISTTTANDILLAGLVCQTVSFLGFFYILILVTYRSNQVRPHVLPPMMTTALIVSSFLVLLRTVFRLAETAQGVFGYASTHEVLFGVLEFAPVGLAAAIWAALSLDSMLPLERANHELEKWDGRKPSFGGLAATIST